MCVKSKTAVPARDGVFLLGFWRIKQAKTGNITDKHYDGLACFAGEAGKKGLF
jgi:hypothetical protein